MLSTCFWCSFTVSGTFLAVVITFSWKKQIHYRNYMLPPTWDRNPENLCSLKSFPFLWLSHLGTYSMAGILLILALRRVECPTSGIWLECWTDQPGCQFYTGNFVPKDDRYVLWYSAWKILRGKFPASFLIFFITNLSWNLMIMCKNKVYGVFPRYERHLQYLESQAR